MSTAPTLRDALVAECATVAGELAGTPWPEQADAIVRRLGEPLRVAVAGRVKAGKSTLLNALIGERLAATDAGECTRIPTVYRRGDSYRVDAVRRDGSTQELRFARDGGALQVDLGSLAVDDIAQILVDWPTEALRDVTFIDTPGLASLDDHASVRTRDLLALDDDRTSDADAVIYCLRHLHRSDVGYLGAFMDRSLSNASAANAVAVLTRADEVGAGRPDALDSARRIAARYATEDRVRSLCSDVLAVAGLLGETGHSLREDEAATVRALAALPEPELALLLVSADRFGAAARSAIAPELRRELLERLGLFGVRTAVEVTRAHLATGHRITARELSLALVQRSGIVELRTALRAQFAARAELLKARSALLALRDLAHRMATDHPEESRRVIGRLEQLEASSLELLVLRLGYLLSSPEVRLRPTDRAAATVLLQGSTVAARLGVGPDTASGGLRAAAAAAAERWRGLAGAGLLDPITTEVAEGLAHLAERLHHDLTQ